MGFVGDLRSVLAEPHFGRLYATRLTSQFADGLLQASLASAILFSPERQTDAAKVAAGFSVLLLPYSLVGPFAGVLLDRWRRQRVLMWANVVRAGIVLAVAVELIAGRADTALFFATALAALSVNRFYLAGVAAALPHVVPPGRLVMANSVSATSGFVATVLGGALGVGIGALAGGGDRGDATVATTACVIYLAAAGVAGGIARDLLGPDAPASRFETREDLHQVMVGFVEGARHVGQHRRTLQALVTIAAQRLLFGVTTISSILLYRNYFTDRGVLRAGLPGLGQVVVVGGIGYVLAAAATPLVTARVTKEVWIVSALGMAATAQLLLQSTFRQPLLLVAALFLGFAAQAIKICVDTIIQEDTDETFRGRVFSLYDTLFNVCFVASAAIGAILLPPTGASRALAVVVGVGYGLTAVAYGIASHRRRSALTPGQRMAEVTSAGR